MGKVNDAIDDIKSVSQSSKELLKNYQLCKAAVNAGTPQIPMDIQELIMGKN